MSWVAGSVTPVLAELHRSPMPYTVVVGQMSYRAECSICGVIDHSNDLELAERLLEWHRQDSHPAQSRQAKEVGDVQTS